MKGPRAVIGAPVYNHEREFREAVGSILAQTFRDFRLVIVDDGSTDGTGAIAGEYAERDPRVTCVRNDRRLGMIDNWRRAFELSTGQWPDAEYFAWASDHDVWHPQWLEHLIAALDAAPNAVLAYPFNRRVGAERELVDKYPWKFETRGIASRGRRFRLAVRNMSAGNMIYGLMRTDAVKACGIFRHVLMPDRLLLTELSLRGEFLQMPEVLWFRRWYGAIFSLRRQRRAFFPNGRPIHTFVPWWITHAAVIGWLYGIHGMAAPTISRLQGLGYSVVYVFGAGLFNFRQQVKQVRLDVLERAAFLKPAYDELHKLGMDKVRRRTQKLGRRLSKRFGVRDALGSVRKNLADPARRLRFRTKMMKQMRKRANRLTSGISRLSARGVRALPVVGPRLVPWLLREQLQMSTGAIESLRLQRTLDRLRHTKGPVLIGPFLAEPEFELLYWIPFVRWLQAETGLDPARCTVVSRGGAGAWYDGLCAHAIDALGLMRLAELRARHPLRWQDGGLDRDITPSALDSQLLAAAHPQDTGAAPVIVHPAEMQPLFRHVWRGTAPVDLLARHVVRRRLIPPPLPEGQPLPAGYVAVRFAFSPAFPDTQGNQRASRALIESLAATQPVVLLHTGYSVDGLEEFDPGPLPNLVRLHLPLTPADSLGVLSAVLGHAAAFTGSFSGFSCLAALYGVPGLSLYSDRPGATAALIDELYRTTTALDTSAVVVHVRDLATPALSGLAAQRSEAASRERA